VFFYRLLTKTPLPQPHVRSGRHYDNLLPSSAIAASILRKAGYTSKSLPVCALLAQNSRTQTSLRPARKIVGTEVIRSK
jgi:hypothetical protein